MPDIVQKKGKCVSQLINKTERVVRCSFFINMFWVKRIYNMAKKGPSMGLGGSKIGQNGAKNGQKSLKSDSTIKGRKLFYKSLVQL